jgi:hypothetical protein
MVLSLRKSRELLPEFCTKLAIPKRSQKIFISAFRTARQT